MTETAPSQTFRTTRRVEFSDTDAAGIALWDLRNKDGEDAASGVYLALLDGGGTRTLKVAVQR